MGQTADVNPPRYMHSRRVCKKLNGKRMKVWVIVNTKATPPLDNFDAIWIVFGIKD